jgi:hypothetical protein
MDEENIKKLYTNYINETTFKDKSLCFRIFAPNIKVNVKTTNDEDIEVMADA